MQELNQEKQVEHSAPTLKETVESTVVSEDFSPNNPPWNSAIAFVFWLLSVFFIAVVPMVILLPFALGQNINVSDQSAFTEFLKTPKAIFVQVVSVIPAHILTLILAWVIVTKGRKYSFFKMLGWKWKGFNWWKCLLILFGIFVVAAVTSNFFPEQDNDFLKILRSSRMTVFAVAFLATFSAPLVEEVVYRGILYSAFQKTFNIPVAVVIVTILFSIVHVPQYLGSPSTIFLIFVLSLVLTLVRVKYDNLLPCIILHFFINGIQSVGLLLEPYLPVPENINALPETASFIIFSLKHFL